MDMDRLELLVKSYMENGLLWEAEQVIGTAVMIATTESWREIRKVFPADFQVALFDMGLNMRR